jgi:ADP-ribose pyrophosphatase YjhB (NUDIX family)
VSDVVVGAPDPDFTAGLPTKRMAAGVLFTDTAGRVLLVEPAYKSYWEIPGGCVEADESPLAAARREIAEELALDRAVGRLLAVDWVPPRPGRTEGLMMVFDGGVLDAPTVATIRVPSQELRGYAFCDADQAAARLPPLLVRRVTECLAARESGAVAYLEDGCPVGPVDAAGRLAG